MAISKMDCLVLLNELKANNIDTTSITNTLLKNDVCEEVLRFINSNRQMDVTAFYEKLRQSYNHKHSKLYKNIVKEIEDPSEVLTTLSGMLTQSLLYSKNLPNKDMFLHHVRAVEISKVLLNYFKTYDITVAIKLLKLIKADIKTLEYVNKN